MNEKDELIRRSDKDTITADKWIELLSDNSIFHEDDIDIVVRMYDFGKSYYCRELAQKYGDNENTYSRPDLYKRIAKKCGITVESKDYRSDAYSVMLYKDEDSVRSHYTLKEEFVTAMEKMSFPDAFLYAPTIVVMNIDDSRVWGQSIVMQLYLDDDARYIRRTNKNSLIFACDNEKMYLCKYKDESAPKKIGNEDDGLKEIHFSILNEYEFAASGEETFRGRTCVINLTKPDIQHRKWEKYVLEYIQKVTGYTEEMLLEMLRSTNLYKNKNTNIQSATSIKTEPSKRNNNMGLNTILYGPPGTGKTYNTAIYAVAICDGKPISELTDYNAVMSRYNELKEHGRVAFTTFHQSYGYEEFIEGIKPVVDGVSEDISYTIEPGVFKRFCEKASRPEKSEISFTGKLWAIRNRAGDKDVRFDLNEYMYSNGVIVVEDIADYRRQCDVLKKIENGDWVILGREFHIDAVGVVTDFEPEEINQEPFHWARRVKWLAKNLNSDFSTIDKTGYAFSNFAIAKSKLKPKDLYSLIKVETESKPYVFIVDEINRGNISKIFGELITLIEDTKRAGMPEAASAILPYSGEEFSVPSNVYILGTMNTADRSIALMDTALRRRFQFVEMMPNADILRKIGSDKISADGLVLDVATMLETINERISFLYDREHTIGHAFFTGIKDDSSIEKLASIFEKSVIPLLQEYFYEDYQKIQLVLGDNGKTDDNHKFIKDIKVVAKNIFKGRTDDMIELPEKKYEINEDALLNIQSYIEIM